MAKIPNEILIKIARESIRIYLETNKKADFSNLMKIYPDLSVKQGSFVTLKINGNLRGCIGRLEGEDCLAADIGVNAVDAAFNDSRFLPLSKKEFPKIKIEVSVITDLGKIRYSSEKDLFRKLEKEKCGVIIKYKGRRSTFLPQVWETFGKAQVFMEELAYKGGFPSGIWNEKECEIYSYHAEVIEEK